VSELKPCPFCGGRAEIQRGAYTQYVMCLKCEVMGPNLSSDEELSDAWNRRAPASEGEQK
jgi:Lar family restriction alleviation protein